MYNRRGSLRHGFDPLPALMALLAAGLLLRLLLAAVLGLGIDESYVVSVARSFSLSYFDHPPLHFWLVRASALLAGSEQPLVLRLPFILLFAGTTWLMFWLTRFLFGGRAGFYAALLLNVSAVFSLSSGSWVLPDGPLLFFLLAAAAVLARLLYSPGQAQRLPLWLAFGLLTGLGMLSKYHAVFLLAGLFVYLLTSPAARWLLFSPGPYIAVAAAFAVFSPVLIWNAGHGWVSFLFHSGRAVSQGFSPGAFAANIAGQAVWLLPWIWLPLAWVLACGLLAGPEPCRRQTQRDKIWLLSCLASGPVIFFTAATLWGAQGLFHWQAPGYLIALPLLGRAAAETAVRFPRLVAVWLRGSVAAFLLLVLVLASHTATGWLAETAPQLFAHGDPTLESLDWLDLPPALARQGYLAPAAGENYFIVATNWMEAGKIDYALGGALPVIVLSPEPHHYPFVHSLPAFKGRDALIISRQDSQPAMQPYFDSLTRLPDVTVHRRQRAELKLILYQARSFHGDYPLPFGVR
ncbi:MAG: glycosyltransferase family 39 protein [Sporomusaceae bacterium]|nr:glycosyltransferase family 39 protein [Sporomusaceae bacterium]